MGSVGYGGYDNYGFRAISELDVFAVIFTMLIMCICCILSSVICAAIGSLYGRPFKRLITEHTDADNHKYCQV